MILLFPDLDTVRLVVGGGLVPADITSGPVRLSHDAGGRPYLDTDAKLTKKVTADLAKLGVVGSKRHAGDVEELACWAQAIPVTRDAATPALSNQAAVLFELPSAEAVPAIVGEMLRLGNDRQSYRFLAASGDTRVLLRVVGPPYYSLLRAIDDPTGTVRAFVEAAPRVWVQLGHSHPFAAQIKPADEQMVLIRPPRAWEFLPDAPFRDIYESLDFQLPAEPSDWAEAKADKMTVPLRLTAGNAADQAELWVLKGAAADKLDGFVRDADDRLTQRLKFAVATGPDGVRAVVLRTSPSKLGPPALPLADAVGFKPYWKLPNLYVPAGQRLHPTLRRETVRTLLAPDPDTLVWLYPTADGHFTPETLPEDAFRPLDEWVDYVIETAHAPLAEWVAATSFDFDQFVCNDSGTPKPKDPDKGQPKPKKGSKGDDAPVAVEPAAPKGKKAADKFEPVAAAEPAVPKPPSEWKLRRDALEKRFLDHDGPLDADERVALWPELANANAGAGDAAEAGVCWANALWQPDVPPDGWLKTWASQEGTAALTAADLDARFAAADPTPAEVRQTAAGVLFAAYQPTVPAWLTPRLPALQRYIEANERKLPVRTVWLVASRLSQLTGADVLGLARVRDRLLQRLLDDGLNPERDLPSFLRYAGLKDSDRVRQVREKAVELHRLARNWATDAARPGATGGQTDHGATLAYIDLLFAYGLARLGESEATKRLVELAAKQFDSSAPTEELRIAAGFLMKGFKHRIDTALAGKPVGGRLPPELQAELDEIHKKANAQVKNENPYRLAHYAITRMQEQSRVFEPQEKLDPYNEYMKNSDTLRQELGALPKKTPAALADSIRTLYRKGVDGRKPDEVRFLVLSFGLPLAARVGEAFTLELVNLVPEVLAAPTAGPASSDHTDKLGKLLERALFLAAHFDRREVVQKLVEQFLTVVHKKPEEERFDLVNAVAGQSLRSLRKLGLKDEIDKLLKRLQAEILNGQTATQLRSKYASKPDSWAKALQTLLNLAGGWLAFGLSDQAAPILDAARAELLTPGGLKLNVKEFAKLTQAYVAAVGQGPADAGLARIAELFQQMDRSRVTNTFTTSKFYSRLHLNVVEEVVLAVVSDDFAVGPAGRRWLDDDEFLVRRRIHADMRRHLARSGL